MLKAGLLEEIAAEDDEPAWRTTENGERLCLRATLSGLAAVSAGGAPAGQVEVKHAKVDTPTQLVSEQPRPEGSVIAQEVEAQPSAQVTRPGLHAAAQAVVAAWDEADGGRPDLSTAIDKLRAALTRPAGVRTRETSGLPRPDTKRAAVLALLRRPEGATVAQVADETGWATHTVRGFFAGLKKAGTPVGVLERVRQVGPGREGAKGSYTVYHVTEAA